MLLRRAIAELRDETRSRRRTQQYVELYRKFQGHTMVPKREFCSNLALAERIADVEGAIVECGVWRGGMAAAIAAICGARRKAFLFDSFEGLPAAKEIDGQAAMDWQRATDADDYFDNCTAPRAFADEAMRMSGVGAYELVEGWFEDTVPAFPPCGPIALLRLDCDWYDSVMVCLDRFFNDVAPGGVVIVDDYYTWDGCARALHDFLSRSGAVERLHEHERVCYLVKR